MSHRFWGLMACVFVLGLGSIGAAGCGSDGTSEVTLDDSDVVTPGEGTVSEGEGGDEVVPPAAALEDCAVAGDEDGDGVADCLDADCAADPACALPPPAVAEGDCLDGIDGDSDGALDCADTDCAADPACALPPAVAVEDCATVADEDGDGQGQCSDTDCAGDPACSGGGGGPWEIDPSLLEKFKAVDQKPFPGPGPVCLSCPDPFEKPVIEQGFGF
ncbi:MAG TPA: hypothetical protein VLJ37_07265 [bacterium]|nr:hypothetical protein [bacterium]